MTNKTAADTNVTIRSTIAHLSIKSRVIACTSIGTLAAALTVLVFVPLGTLDDATPEIIHEGPDFTQYEAGPARKKAFFDYFRPIVESRNRELLDTRAQLIELRGNAALNNSQKTYVQGVAVDFGMKRFSVTSSKHWDTLLRRVDVVPPSLALAQAANESAWGTSRFARKGNNFFGQWCFTKGCGLVPRARDAGKIHEVAAFDTPHESVARYMNNLNSHDAYTPLRQIRSDLRANNESVTGLALAGGLTRYSERGPEYIRELREMIRFNQLARLDKTPGGNG